MEFIYDTQEKNTKRISMQYPFDSSGTNRMFDGQVHEILPRNLRTITLRGRQFYVMDYYDFNAGTTAITLLTRIGNTLAKVPLDDYDFLFYYLEHNQLPSIDISNFNFPNKIPLAQMLCASEILPPPHSNLSFKNEEPVFPFLEYVPLTPRGTGQAKGGAFSPAGILIQTDGVETYHFRKAPSFSLKDEGIQQGIASLPEKLFEPAQHKFRIRVPEGTTANVLSVDSEGRVRQQLLLLIPGLHEYTIVYAPCRLREDYIASRKASEIKIKTTWPEYRDRHDRDQAFYDGCQWKLPMRFYNASGESLNPHDNELYSYAGQSK